MTLEEVQDIRAADRNPTSLDKGVGEDGDAALGDLIADDAETPDQEVANDDSRLKVLQVVSELPSPDRDVLTLRYGLGRDGEEVALRETGRRLGLLRRERAPDRGPRPAPAGPRGRAGSAARRRVAFGRARSTAAGAPAAGSPPATPAEPAHGRTSRRRAQSATTASAPRLSPRPAPVTIAPERPSITCLSGSASATASRAGGRLVAGVEDPRDEHHGQEDRVHVGGGGVEVGDHVRERDPERAERDHPGRGEHDQRDPVLRPAHVVEEVADRHHEQHLHEGVGHRAAQEAREVGRRPASACPRRRLRMPCSRRKVRLNAIALKVVAITLSPAMPGISTSSCVGVAARTPRPRAGAARAAARS